MCLAQTRNGRKDETGNLCVDKSFSFGVIKDIVGDFTANGIIGLAPSHSKESYINALWD